MNNLHKLSTILLCSAFLLGGCTEETKQKGTDPVIPDTADSRREVMMTLKNKLSVKPVSSKAGTPIATAAENTISTLDVYVFGATEESGDYTFLERFAYRADAGNQLPQGATELQLNTTGTDSEEATGLLKLKKGLFVKLYCIANDTTLVDPVTARVVKPADFTPITFTESEDGTPRLATEGIPHENTFTTWHTQLLSAAAKADTLATPLAMAGALTTPLDLTDSGSAERLQIGFRLTRLVARYDIMNEAGTSRFIIETVSIGKARRGSGYFPIRPYGDIPEAKPDELITSPERRFYGENANKGLQTGAFYSYPSPEKDNAFLILKGMYKVNETEYKEVSYQVPFTRQNENGTATIFEIANNHRYTLAVTAADQYHLDCNISVDDWADDGSIIEFNPNDDTGELNVTIPEGFKDDTKYDPDTRSVSMSLKPGSQFELKTTASSNLTVEKKYVGGLAAQQYDWLEVSEPAVSTRTALNFAYTFSLKDGYTGRYPRAVLRFTNTMNGDETTFFVEAVSMPQADNTPQPGINNPNTFDAENLLVSLYRTTGSNAHVRITCPDGTEVESKPNWLDVAIDKQNGAETIYSFTLNDRDITDVPEDKGTVTFRNSKAGDLKTDITVQLLDATVKPDFTSPSIDGTKNSYEAATDDKPANINMQISDANNFAITCRSMQGIEIGIDFDGGPEWLKATGANVTKAYNDNANLTFSLDNTKLGGAKKATVTLKNKVGGKNTVFTVSPVFLVPTVAFVSGSNSPTQNTMSGTDIKLYQVAGSKVSIKANAFGGTCVKTLTGDITVTADDNYNAEKTYVVTWKSGTSASFVIANKSDETKEATAYTVSAPATTITATDNLNMNTLASQNVTNTINSPEGCTASVNWGTSGQAWFDLSATNFNANNQTLKMTTKSNITTLTNIQKATITLINKITGGAVKTFTITPVYQFISAEQTSSTSASDKLNGTTFNMLKASALSAYHAQITLKVLSLGGSKVTVSGTGLKISGAASSTAYTASYILDAASNAATSGTLTITNYQNSGSKKTYTISVKDQTVTYTSKSTGKTYPALEMTSYWVAPVTEGLWNYNDAQSKCPDGWKLPNRDDFRNFVNNDLQGTKDVFLPGVLLGDGGFYEYWGSSRNDNGKGHVIDNSEYCFNFWKNPPKTYEEDPSYKETVRCIKNK